MSQNRLQGADEGESMRDAFPEYYPLTPPQVRACVLEGTIVLDTNVLNALYRFSTAERQQLLDVLDQVHDRLWVPHQVALEYQRGRESVIKGQPGQYESVVSYLAPPTKEALDDRLRGLALPTAVREEVEALLDEYVGAVGAAAEPFVERAKDLIAGHVVTQEQGHKDDPVRRALDRFLDGRVGPRVDDKDRDARIQEALLRYQTQTPPGWKDSKKDSDELRAGDYLLWCEMLDHAANLDAAASVLFVTGDVKEDWFTRDGEPLPALRREFAEHSPATYHQVTLPDFLRLANEHLDSKVSGDTIDRATHLPHAWTWPGDLAKPHLDFTFDPEISRNVFERFLNSEQENRTWADSPALRKAAQRALYRMLRESAESANEAEAVRDTGDAEGETDDLTTGDDDSQ